MCYSLVQPFPPGVVLATNLLLFNITISQKLPPSARFILQGVDFHSRFLDFAGMTISVWGSRFRGNDNSYLGCGGSRLRENDKLEIVNKEIPAFAGIDSWRMTN